MTHLVGIVLQQAEIPLPGLVRGAASSARCRRGSTVYSAGPRPLRAGYLTSGCCGPINACACPNAGSQPAPVLRRHVSTGGFSLEPLFVAVPASSSARTSSMLVMLHFKFHRR